MRLLVLTFFAAASIGAADVAPVPAPDAGSVPAATPEGVEVKPALTMRPCTGSIAVFDPEACPPHALSVDSSNPPDPANCKDRIQQVRDASGQPALDKAPAATNEGYMINAVEKRVDGCAVMQMEGNVNDLRPLPAPSPDAPLLQPAR